MIKRRISALALTAFILFILPSLRGFAEINTQYSLRKCMLLPLSGDAEGVDQFSVYRRIEIYLKDSRWCYYRSNADILNMLQNYRKNMSSHLKNADILGQIAAKTQSGSLIRVTIEDGSDGVEIMLKVIGDNGEDVFFGERATLKSAKTKNISNTVIEWLERYQETIPYDGRIVRSSEREFLMDVGSASKVSLGDKLVIERPTERRIHPLLNEVVGWKKELVGMGKVINVSRFQSHVQIIPDRKKKSLLVGDWIRVEKNKSPMKEAREIERASGIEGFRFGQLGLFSVGLKGGMGSDTVTTVSLYRGQRVAGFLLGANMGGEIWLTKNFLLGIDLERNLGSYSGPENKSILSSVGITEDMLKLKAGYRFLAADYFWGPRVDVYLGYGIYNYDLDIFSTEGLGHHGVSGVLAGGRASFPFMNRYRGFIEANTLLFASYEETTNIFGNNTSSITSYQLEVGAKYYVTSKMAFQGSFEMISNKVTFKENTSFHFGDLALRGEAIFSY